MKDYSAISANDAQPLIDKLAGLESKLKEARKAKKDRNIRDAIERQMDAVRSALLSKYEPSLVYMHLTSTSKANAEEFRSAWQKDAVKVNAFEPLQKWGIEEFFKSLWDQPVPELANFPYCSFYIRFQFTLSKPYISKDENSFYITDNPIVRDKVFRLPMVRATSWKGNLYSTLWQLGHDKQTDEQMQRLFGEIRGDESSEQKGKAGRLFFYPTFYTQTSLEIINPHDRKRRVGKNPILFESVPDGAKGTFNLLYVPFDLIGRKSKMENQNEAVEDLCLVAEGISAMMLTYGFSAKRTSGYGVTEERVQNGILRMRLEEPTPVQPCVPSPGLPSQLLPKYLEAPGRLKSEYLNLDGTFCLRSEAEMKSMTKAQRQEYEKACKWWEREGKWLISQPPAEPEPTPSLQSTQPLERRFSTFVELRQEANEVAQRFRSGGEE